MTKKFKVRSVQYSASTDLARIRTAYEVMGKIALRILKEEKNKNNTSV